ncbi:HNH endonuclease family protein, partial [Psychrobacter celer]
LVNHQNSFSRIEDELVSISKYSQIFKTINNPQGQSPLEILSVRLSTMDNSTVYPLLMLIEGDIDITWNDKQKYYRLLDSYFTRRLLCGMTSKNYNKVVLDLIKFIDKDKDYYSFESFLISKSSESALFPSNELLKHNILNEQIYEPRKSKFLANLFLEVEKCIRNNKQESITIKPEFLTIEHLLPQNWHEHWTIDDVAVEKRDIEIASQAKFADGNKKEYYQKIDARNVALHTLGNLTILTNALNPSISNSNFMVKKRAIIEQSTLMLNRYFYDFEEWNEEAIAERGEALYRVIKDIWAHPSS